MTFLSASNPEGTCEACGAPLSATLRYCPTCQTDAGAPNVRRCLTEENVQALFARCEASRSRIGGNGCLKEFSDFEAVIKEKSGVVVSMSAGIARRLLEEPKSLYANYERLVDANARKPADSDGDQHRCAVGGLLFGSYANCIVYGVLSLTEEGLPTYGPVHCRLRSVTIDKRTSFLESNSYGFVRDHNVLGTKLPLGYMACWTHRHSLVLAKLATRLSTGQTESDWQAMLLHSDGQSRDKDDFVEAHIYGGFDANAIESLAAVPGKKLKREEKLDLKIAISRFNRTRGKTK